MAARELVGGGGSVRASEREEAEEGGRVRERVREFQGVAWRRRETSRGEEEAARQGGSCVPARTASGTASPLPTAKRRKTAMSLVGWAKTGTGRPEAPGKKPR